MSPKPPEVSVNERRASLFRLGRHQAVDIPREFEMEGSEVLIRKDGYLLFLSPIRRHRLRDLLASWEPMADALPDPKDLPRKDRDARGGTRLTRDRRESRGLPGLAVEDGTGAAP